MSFSAGLEDHIHLGPVTHKLGIKRGIASVVASRVASRPIGSDCIPPAFHGSRCRFGELFRPPERRSSMNLCKVL